ncbi:hypothetical protein DNTS_025144 [Danionella cerebrum]|uniref:CUB domain-containing protein n=1 Tax=Danionella cerebrum TaxID=2873325 RepID=A0A553R8L6_9TELE|nr:hypothetical protein DNTS_025144 [Danionella translucida]
MPVAKAASQFNILLSDTLEDDVGHGATVGFQLPAPIVSTGPRLTLWLLSDYAVSGQGFKAFYEGKTLNVSSHFTARNVFSPSMCC